MPNSEISGTEPSAGKRFFGRLPVLEIAFHHGAASIIISPTVTSSIVDQRDKSSCPRLINLRLGDRRRRRSRFPSYMNRPVTRAAEADLPALADHRGVVAGRV